MLHCSTFKLCILCIFFLFEGHGFRCGSPSSRVMHSMLFSQRFVAFKKTSKFSVPGALNGDPAAGVFKALHLVVFFWGGIVHL